MNAIVYNLIFLKWNGRAHHLPSDFTLKSRHFAFQGQKFQDIAHRIYISNHVFQSCIHPSVDRDVQSDCGGMCAMVKSWILYIYMYPYRGMVINPWIPIMRIPIMGWMTIPHMTYTMPLPWHMWWRRHLISIHSCHDGGLGSAMPRERTKQKQIIRP
jgi:hypothetical protein